MYRVRWWSPVPFVVTMLLLSGVPNASAALAVTNVDFPGAVSTHANQVNEFGQIVGYYVDAASVQHGFLLSGGAYKTLDCPAPYTAHNEATGINNLGQVVGNCSSSATVNGNTKSYVAGGGTLTFLSDAPGSFNGASTFARAINDSGVIVGWFLDACQCNAHGFALNGGTYTTLDAPGFPSTYAYGINQQGQIVGATQLTFGGANQGFFLNNGTYTAINDPSAGPTGGTTASSISDAGQVVGSFTDASSVQHGFALFDGSFATIDATGAQSTAVSGNSSSALVGGYKDGSGNLHGFVFQTCQDTLKLSFSAGTLTIGFTVMTTTPGTLSSWIAVGGHVFTLFSGAAIPAVSPAASFNVPLPGLQNVGPVNVITALSNTGGSFCADWKTINTIQYDDR